MAWRGTESLAGQRIERGLVCLKHGVKGLGENRGAQVTKNLVSYGKELGTCSMSNGKSLKGFEQQIDRDH